MQCCLVEQDEGVAVLYETRLPHDIHEKQRKGRDARAPLNSGLGSLLHRIRDPHHSQPLRFGLPPRVQGHAIAAEENNPGRGELVVQHLVVAF